MTNIVLNDVLALGFIYDQVAVPTSPAVGETWRERSNSGLIVKDWFWNGTIWLTIQQFFSAPTTVSSLNFGTRAMTIIPVAENIYFEKIALKGRNFEGQPSTSTFNIRLNIEYSQFMSFSFSDTWTYIGSAITTEGWIDDTTSTTVGYINQLVDFSTSDKAKLRFRTDPTGAAGIFVGTASVTYRIARP